MLYGDTYSARKSIKVNIRNTGRQTLRIRGSDQYSFADDNISRHMGIVFQSSKDHHILRQELRNKTANYDESFFEYYRLQSKASLSVKPLVK